MAKTRITMNINGRQYESPEAMPPEMRRAYEEVMRLAGPSLKDEDGNGIPDLLERADGQALVEHQIVVNGQTYRNVDELTPELRRLYDEAMRQVRRGSGLSIGREGPTISIGFSTSAPPRMPSGAPAVPKAIEPSAIESSLRNAVVLIAILVVGGLAAWAFLGR